jgi:hypothetical protein
MTVHFVPGVARVPVHRNPTSDSQKVRCALAPDTYSVYEAALALLAAAAARMPATVMPTVEELRMKVALLAKWMVCRENAISSAQPEEIRAGRIAGESDGDGRMGVPF